MRLHILSDLHREFHAFAPSVRDADVVVLAGDIDIKCRGVKWAAEAFDCPVIYVPGNHEFYKGHLERTLQKMRALASDKVRVLDCDECVIAGVRFLGAIGWTDYSATGNVPLAELDAMQQMNDFKKIRTGPSYRKTRPADFGALSVRAKAWLRERLLSPFDGPTVVVTHHAPSVLSLKTPSSTSSHLDAAYANRWEDLMGEGLDLWIHGHSHHAVDYEIGGTRIVSNPGGYPGERTGFQHDLIIELGAL